MPTACDYAINLEQSRITTSKRKPTGRYEPAAPTRSDAATRRSHRSARWRSARGHARAVPLAVVNLATISPHPSREATISPHLARGRSAALICRGRLDGVSHASRRSLATASHGDSQVANSSRSRRRSRRHIRGRERESEKYRAAKASIIPINNNMSPVLYSSRNQPKEQISSARWARPCARARWAISCAARAALAGARGSRRAAAGT